jgi:hypothetical protein
MAPGNVGINMPMPTGAQAVPLADPHWDQNDDDEEEWHQCHFIHLIVEGLKRAKVKPLNYSQVTVVQGLDKNSLTFLQCLKDTIQKHTTVDPESQANSVSPRHL